jgi:hypothetical protein
MRIPQLCRALFRCVQPVRHLGRRPRVIRRVSSKSHASAHALPLHHACSSHCTCVWLHCHISCAGWSAVAGCIAVSVGGHSPSSSFILQPLSPFILPFPASARACLDPSHLPCHAAAHHMLWQHRMLQWPALIRPQPHTLTLTHPSQIEVEMLDCAPLASEGVFPAARHPITFLHDQNPVCF